MRLYHKLNLNPQNHNTDDCVIRSIALVTKKDWQDIFKELAERARANYYSMNDNHIVRPYLESLGFNRVTRWQRRLTIKDVVYWCRANNVDAVAFNAEHCVGIYKGQLHDTWNSLCSMVKDIYVYKQDPNTLNYDIVEQTLNGTKSRTVNSI